MKKMFNEGNQIHNLMSSSGYGSGSTSQKVTVPTVPVPVPVPVPQHWIPLGFQFFMWPQSLWR
jgi:hypothetical protein